MKKLEILKIQIFMTIFILLIGYIGCVILGTLEKIAMNLHPMILWLAFCYLLYKFIRKEIER